MMLCQLSIGDFARQNNLFKKNFVAPGPDITEQSKPSMGS